MVDTFSRLVDNLRRVQESIRRAAAAAGRLPEEVRLIGVTKYVDAEHAALLAAAGCRDLGESRPQQLWEKAADPRLAPVRWHLIGHLQRNKVLRTLPLAACIHSLDSRRLLDAVDESAEQLGLSVRGLLEVNCSGEGAKQGFAADEIAPLLQDRATWPRVEIVGLMTMAPREGGRAAAQRTFAALRALRDRVAAEVGPPLAELSMGMSGDYEEAIGEGATMVRVGSSLWEGVA
jgi:pyridoxal phosphate enzyme (YggS family)